MTFRVFTNDRGRKKRIPMYSALTDIQASNAEAAQAKAGRRFVCFGPPEYLPVKAIEWPATSQESKEWLAKHT